jgi:hypothetical protein
MRPCCPSIRRPWQGRHFFDAWFDGIAGRYGPRDAGRAQDLSPFHYHSFVVPSGTATMTGFLADRSAATGSPTPWVRCRVAGAA